jgi:hypothetical protein
LGRKLLRNRFRRLSFVSVLGILIFSTIFGQLQFVSCQSEREKNKALVYIHEVLPYDTTKYLVTFEEYSDNSNFNSSNSYLTQRFTFKLTNGQNEATVNCAYKDGIPVALQVRNVIGSITSYSDNELIGISKQVLERHGIQTQANLTELTMLLDQLSNQVNTTKVYGQEIMLSVSHALVPSGLTTENGYVHISSPKPMYVIKFEWYYLGVIQSASNLTLNQNIPIFQLTYMNGALYSLYDNQVWVKQSQTISSTITPMPTTEIPIDRATINPIIAVLFVFAFIAIITSGSLLLYRWHQKTTKPY